MRCDHRAAEALRPVSIERHYIKNVPGSVLVSFGDTRILCAATLSDKVPAWRKGSKEGWVTAEYGMLPASTPERVPRDNIQRGRAQEISRLIGRSLRAVTDLAALGECLVTLDCDVLQADGGTRTAAITGAYVALHDALSASVAAGYLKALPLTGQCAAVSAGCVHGDILLDLCYREDVAAEVDLNIVMDDTGRFIEVQGCAEGAPFPRPQLDAMLDLAATGIARLIACQKEALGLA